MTAAAVVAPKSMHKHCTEIHIILLKIWISVQCLCILLGATIAAAVPQLNHIFLLKIWILIQGS